MPKAGKVVAGIFVGAAICLVMLFYAGVVDAAYVRPDPAQRDGFNVDTATGSLIVLRAGVKILTISSSGDLTVSDDLAVTDDATVGGDLTVTGQSLGQAGWELIAVPETATVPGDCNKVYATSTHLTTVLLPAVAATNAGCCVTLLNTGASGAAFVGFSVNASDAVFGEIANSGQDSAASGTDDQAWGNTRATAIKGDRAKLCSDGVTGWFITEGVGIWASAAQ